MALRLSFECSHLGPWLVTGTIVKAIEALEWRGLAEYVTRARPLKVIPASASGLWSAPYSDAL